jgi:hypothetical protein
MKKVIHNYILLLIALAAVSGCKRSENTAGPLNAFKRYSYKNFHIHYELSGEGRGIEDVYVSDYGKYESQFSRSDVFSPKGINSENHTLLTRISDIYGIDNTQRNYQHSHVSSLDSLYHLDAGDIPTTHKYMENEMKKTMLFQTGMDTIEGKLALRWQMSDGFMTVWTWNDILLRKSVSTQDGPIVMTMKSFDSLWTVDTTKFMIPQGYFEGKPEQGSNAPHTN